MSQFLNILIKALLALLLLLGNVLLVISIISVSSVFDTVSKLGETARSFETTAESIGEDVSRAADTLTQAGQDISRAVDELDQVQADIHRVAESFDRNANTMSAQFRGPAMLEHAGQDVNRAADVLDWPDMRVWRRTSTRSPDTASLGYCTKPNLAMSDPKPGKRTIIVVNLLGSTSYAVRPAYRSCRFSRFPASPDWLTRRLCWA